MVRRDFLKGLTIIPFAASVSGPSTVRPGHPEPECTLLGSQNGVTTITRAWASGQHRRCSLCRECYASEIGNGNAVCSVLTTETVTEDEAPLYSIRHLPHA